MAPLLRALQRSGRLQAAQVRDCLKLHRATRGAGGDVHPLVWLAERELPDAAAAAPAVLDLESLTRWLAAQLGMTYLRIDPLTIEAEAVSRVVSAAYAARHRILPVRVDASSACFATAYPFDRAWEGELRHVLQRDIERVLANPLDVARYQVELFGVGHSIRKASRTEALQGPGGLQDLEALVRLGGGEALDANDQHVVHIVDWLLHYAFAQRASDIHLEPRRDGGNVRFRIDGVLHTVYSLPAGVLRAVTSRLKALGRLDVVEKRRPQDGRVKTRSPQGEEVELRLSTMPTAFGEKLVMRIFDPAVLSRSLEQLGFGDAEVAAWQALSAQSHGIILVTGPTGSGKTTTLYATLRALARPEVNLCTVEDPIEMIEPTFNQMQVNASIDLGFAAGVRTLLRQDPDIIMVGEIRDQETAEGAIQAALTGHLVFSTLHTNDAVASIARLLDLGVPAYLLNATVLGVMAQRLVRTLCSHCKAPTVVDPELWERLVQPWQIEPPSGAMQAVGCAHCRGTGYHGRVGLYEILRPDPAFRSLVQPGCAQDSLRQAALRAGLRPLRLSGARQIAAGVTCLTEVLRVVPLGSSV